MGTDEGSKVERPGPPSRRVSGRAYLITSGNLAWYVGAGVAVGVWVGVAIGVSDGIGVGVLVAIGVSVGVIVGVGVGQPAGETVLNWQSPTGPTNS